MEMESLYLSRERYGEDAGLVTGTIIFRAPKGDIKVKIDHTHAMQILNIIADILLAQTKEAANVIRANIITQVEEDAVRRLT
jgi:hypothetical protein